MRLEHGSGYQPKVHRALFRHGIQSLENTGLGRILREEWEDVSLEALVDLARCLCEVGWNAYKPELADGAVEIRSEPPND
jgi:hypothetical protein